MTGVAITGLVIAVAVAVGLISRTM